MRPRLKLRGRSGCQIEVLTTDGHTRVRKHSRDVRYNERLLSQLQKQQDFRTVADRHPGFSAPAVLATGRDPLTGLMWFDMEYIGGLTFSDFLLRCSPAELDLFIDSLLRFVDDELACSVPRPAPRTPIEAKLHHLSGQLAGQGLHDSFALQAVTTLLNNIPLGPLPAGSCHGDLTLSNVLIKDDCIYLIDFLDSFVETPLLDIVKMRQDTRHAWSAFINAEIQPHHFVKVLQALDYIDQRVDAYVRAQSHYSDWYQFLEAITLIRIVPYLSSDLEAQYVDNCLRRLFGTRVFDPHGFPIASSGSSLTRTAGIEALSL